MNSTSGTVSPSSSLPPPAMQPPRSAAVAIKAVSDHHNGSSWRDFGSQHHDGMFNSPYSTSHPSTAPGSPRMYATSIRPLSYRARYIQADKNKL